MPSADTPGGMTVDQFCKEMVEAHVKRECKGHLRSYRAAVSWPLITISAPASANPAWP